MDDARRVRLGEDAAHRQDDLGAALKRQPPLLRHLLAERAASEELHHDIRDTLGRDSGVEDRHGVRMIDAARRDAFEKEALQVLIARHMTARTKDLDGDEPLERKVRRAINDAEAAA